ncbi:aminotransferase [Paenibacillus agricola]|uniref:Aminotransferase n=1 Tax=Paenibacillus agricola TaxID=2716264 RepID=A0ABX0J1E9_9BACL|nr:aminotransferase [Paenibacillus agricola]NHN29661.1 aminotransferase [Paenibacillus agricola]
MSIQRPTIGNRGGMHTRSYVAQEPPSFSVGTQLPGSYPGIGSNAYAPPYVANYATPVVQPAPASSSGPLNKLAAFFSGASGSEGGSTINIAQIKQAIDRMGGIDGIMETMGKVQKMVQSVQQMAPLVKVLMGSFGKKKKSRADGAAPRRRRRKSSSAKGIGKTRGKRRGAR